MFKRAFTLAAVITAMSACNASAEKEVKKSEEELKPVAIETFVAEKGKVSGSVQIPGELVAFQQVDLYAKVNCFVQRLHVDVGSEVKKGQLLASMEAPELSAQLSGAGSRLEALSATYDASKANYERLLETSKTPGTISPNDLDQALAKQKADYAQLQAAKAAQREISDNKNYLSVRAPFDGIITTRNVSAGAYVGPAGKGSEQPMFTLQEQKKLRLVVAVPETYNQYLRPNSAVEFLIPSMPGTVFKGTLQRLAGALDSRIRSQRVEIDVINTDKKLLPGMVASVSIPLPARDSSLVVPKSAVVNSPENIYVIKVAEGRAKRISVKKGREMDGKVEIFGELLPGDTLVKAANDEMREGSLIVH